MECQSHQGLQEVKYRTRCFAAHPCPSNAWKPHLDTDKRCKNHYYDREEDRQVSFHTDSDEVVE